MENQNEINIITAYKFFVQNELQQVNQVKKYITTDDIARLLDVSTIEAQRIIDMFVERSVISRRYEYHTIHFHGAEQIKPVGYRFLPICVMN